MRILIALLSIIVFVKTLSYGLYEINEKNKSGGISVIVISVFSLILPNIMIYFRNF